MNSNKYEATDFGKFPVSRSYSITFNSQLAEALDSDGFNNKYSQRLNAGLGAPSHAKTCKVGMISAQVWNFTQNIRSPVNKIYFAYTVSAVPVSLTSISIPSGYYGISELNQQIEIQLQLGGHPTNLFSFSGDSATQKIIANFNGDLTITDIYLDFTSSDSLFNILGIDQRFSPVTAPGTPAQPGDIDLFDNVAQFNAVNAFYIQMPSLIREGIPIGVIGSSVIGQVPTIARPNSLISYSPENIIWIDAEHLIGANITDIFFEITNELLESVVVLDPFNITITIEWSE
jgi:hypothetical protein